MRRAYASGANIFGLKLVMLMFASAVSVEKAHPLQCGFVRLKNRRDRRPGLPIEPALIFYSCFLGEFVIKHAYLLREHIRINRIYHRVVNDPDALGYTDQAMSPVCEDEEDSLELFTQHKAARAQDQDSELSPA